MITSRGEDEIATHCDGTKGAALIADTGHPQSKADGARRTRTPFAEQTDRVPA